MGLHWEGAVTQTLSYRACLMPLPDWATQAAMRFLLRVFSPWELSNTGIHGQKVEVLKPWLKKALHKLAWEALNGGLDYKGTS